MNFTPPHYVGKTQSGGFMAVITGVGVGMWGHSKIDSQLTLPRYIRFFGSSEAPLETINGALFEPLLLLVTCIIACKNLDKNIQN